MKNHRHDAGFTLIQTLISACLAIMFFSVVCFQAQIVSRLERRSTSLARALGVAINTMEELKLEDNLLTGSVEKEEKGFNVLTQVEEFSSSLYRLKVVVKNGNEEILSLQTLRRK